MRSGETTLASTPCARVMEAVPRSASIRPSVDGGAGVGDRVGDRLGQRGGRRAAAGGSPFSWRLPADAQQRGGELTAFSSGCRTPNPAVQSGAATGVPGSRIFAGPARVGADCTVPPCLAESREMSEEALSYTFHLVPGAVGHVPCLEVKLPERSFSDRAVREALAHAIDTRRLSTVIFRGPAPPRRAAAAHRRSVPRRRPAVVAPEMEPAASMLDAAGCRGGADGTRFAVELDVPGRAPQAHRPIPSGASWASRGSRRRRGRRRTSPPGRRRSAPWAARP